MHGGRCGRPLSPSRAAGRNPLRRRLREMAYVEAAKHGLDKVYGLSYKLESKARLIQQTDEPTIEE